LSKSVKLSNHLMILNCTSVGKNDQPPNVPHYLQCMVSYSDVMTIYIHPFNGPLSRTTQVSQY